MTVVVAAFYKFMKIPDYRDKRQPLLDFCQERAVKGTILLAKEGINGTIAGDRHAIDLVLGFLADNLDLKNLEVKKSETKNCPFARMKVKLKKEIVTIGLSEVDPTRGVGTYVSPEDWNELICDPEVIVIDTRNDYEVAIGTFKGAIDPKTESFREFPEYTQKNLDPNRHKKVAMFCTGGIRCEKATSYLLDRGFKEVYHLKGGILKYLEEVPPEESMWEGECFVFDERVTVTENLEPGNYDLCYACGHPISEADKQSPKYSEILSCPHCFDRLNSKKIARQEQKKQQRSQVKERK